MIHSFMGKKRDKKKIVRESGQNQVGAPRMGPT